MRSCLIVDDSSIVRRLARQMIEPLSFEIHEAQDGLEAQVFCLESMPDVILLDSHMPEMDGLEFIAKLRAMHGGTKPRVLLCTTETGEQHIRRALDAGIDDYIIKPFDEKILRAKLEQFGVTH